MQQTTRVNNVDVFTLFGDWGSPGKVRSSFLAANDGTQTQNTATIINSLPQNFYNGRIRFLMNRGDYRVAGGVIEAQYDYAGGAKTAVVVKVNVVKNAVTTVSISKAAFIEDLAELVSWWLVDECGAFDNCNGMDVNTDGTVNLVDFSFLAESWYPDL